MEQEIIDGVDVTGWTEAAKEAHGLIPPKKWINGSTFEPVVIWGTKANVKLTGSL